MPPRIAVVYGTRPEAIKLSKVVEELRLRGVEPTIIATGQHTSLLWGTPAESTMAPHISLGLPSDNDPYGYAMAVRYELRLQWKTSRPDLVVVQGDTASAYAGARAAKTAEIPVAHIEAGIRSGDFADPWPEEEFRIAIDVSASQWLCATEANVDNLMQEDRDHPEVRPPVMTGNSGIDALYSHTRPTKNVVDRVLITLHRRESFGDPLYHLTCGIVQAARKYRQIHFDWPVHPNPKVQQGTAWAFAGDGAGVRPEPNLTSLCPLDTVAFAQKLSTCRAVITDSGGVQEEAAALGIPCIVAREKTDRPESVELGLAKVVGRTEQGILDGLDWALGFSTRPDPSTVFGDGKAAPRIVEHLLGRD